MAYSREFTRRIEDLLGSVLEYSLPGAVWHYRGRKFGNAAMARGFLPLLLRQGLTWIDSLAEPGEWDISSQIEIAPSQSSPCGLEARIDSDAYVAHILLLALDVAIRIDERGQSGQRNSLDELDSPETLAPGLGLD